MLRPGTRAPSFTLADATSGASVADPWTDGRTVLAFYKTTCPVCVMAAPKVAALAQGGARVVAVGEDPAPKLLSYASEHGQDVPTVTEPAPYAVSDAYGIRTVPTLVVVGEDGTVETAIEGWDRDKWNAVAASFGGPDVSDPGDGLPVFRPG